MYPVSNRCVREQLDGVNLSSNKLYASWSQKKFFINNNKTTAHIGNNAYFDFKMALYLNCSDNILSQFYCIYSKI